MFLPNNDHFERMTFRTFPTKNCVDGHTWIIRMQGAQLEYSTKSLVHSANTQFTNKLYLVCYFFHIFIRIVLLQFPRKIVFPSPCYQPSPPHELLSLLSLFFYLGITSFVLSRVAGKGGVEGARQRWQAQLTSKPQGSVP